MFQLQNKILEKYKNYDYYFRTRTDLLINELLITKNLENNRYNSIKWARGISDNIGFANNKIFLDMWSYPDLNQLISLGP